MPAGAESHRGEIPLLIFRSTTNNIVLMKKSSNLAAVLGALADQASVLGYSDSEWARCAAVRKETLCRLRRRQSCDFATLEALAQAVGARLGVIDRRTPASNSSGHFPSRMDREYEEQLVELCVGGNLEPHRWLECGPRFFMAGLAVMLASSPGFPRSRLLALAEELHPGASEPEVLARWLLGTPLQPSRFLPQVDALRNRHAA